MPFFAAETNDWNPFGKPGAGAPLKQHKARNTPTAQHNASFQHEYHANSGQIPVPDSLRGQRWSSSGHIAVNSPVRFSYGAHFRLHDRQKL